ncbi:hypothetical protein [Cupriavidus sp. DF5525]|uniref:hypothetical protein n=1 Tax=Cupriavidus sp. DF5525 TaxID=3160989 RepID=UPI0032DE59E9
MQSKNKKAPTVREHKHIEVIKQMPCGVCDEPGPSDAHELNQGQWFTSIPLCRSCHMSDFNGIHGQQRIWKVLKKDELSVLNETISKVMYGGG